MLQKRRLIRFVISSIVVLILLKNISFQFFNDKSFQHDSFKWLFKQQSKSLIFYYSTHGGTINEIKYALKRHRLPLKIASNSYSLLNKINDHENVLSTEIYLEKLCNQHEMILIGDTIRIGQRFYERMNTNCKAIIGLQITDRFDRWVKRKERDKYMKLMTNMALDPKVFWLPNNNYEMYYLNQKGIRPRSDRIFLIRPYGVKSKVKKYYPKDRANKAIIYIQRKFYVKKFTKNFARLNKNDYEIYHEGNYGGPAYLRNKRIFVYFPYQYSTMKVFDNAVNAIYTAIPSPTFFKQLVFAYQDCFGLVPEMGKFIRENANWTEYFDVYKKDYANMFFQFSSWTDLYGIINNKNQSYLEMKYYHLNKMKSIMSQHHNRVDNEWKSFLNAFKKQIKSLSHYDEYYYNGVDKSI